MFAKLGIGRIADSNLARGAESERCQANSHFVIAHEPNDQIFFKYKFEKKKKFKRKFNLMSLFDHSLYLKSLLDIPFETSRTLFTSLYIVFRLVRNILESGGIE